MMSITAVKFRGEKYVGKKGSENYVMDLRCLNVAGTNKKYFCYWEITETMLRPKYTDASC